MSGYSCTCFVRFVVDSMEVDSVKVVLSPSGVDSSSLRPWCVLAQPSPCGTSVSSVGRIGCSFAIVSLEFSILCGFS